MLFRLHIAETLWNAKSVPKSHEQSSNYVPSIYFLSKEKTMTMKTKFNGVDDVELGVARPAFSLQPREVLSWWKVMPRSSGRMEVMWWDKGEENVGDKFNGVEDVGLGVLTFQWKLMREAPWKAKKSKEENCEANEVERLLRGVLKVSGVMWQDQRCLRSSYWRWCRGYITSNTLMFLSAWPWNILFWLVMGPGVNFV